jgi:SAM-dependent methyltransferase
MPVTHNHDTTVFDEEFWDTLYQARPHAWSGNPNPQLLREATELAPGRALDLGCGEGADALWLAEHGWTVTGMDISTTALERAAEHVAERAAARRITWVHQDLAQWRPKEHFDLISAQFLQLPRELRMRIFDTCVSAVASGGTLLIVGHHPEGLPPWGAGSPPAELYYTPEQLAEDLALDSQSWTVDVLESRTRVATGPAGEDAHLTDTVLRATRIRDTE